MLNKLSLKWVCFTSEWNVSIVRESLKRLSWSQGSREEMMVSHWVTGKVGNKAISEKTSVIHPIRGWAWYAKWSLLCMERKTFQTDPTDGLSKSSDIHNKYQSHESKKERSWELFDRWQKRRRKEMSKQTNYTHRHETVKELGIKKC